MHNEKRNISRPKLILYRLCAEVLDKLARQDRSFVAICSFQQDVLAKVVLENPLSPRIAYAKCRAENKLNKSFCFLFPAVGCLQLQLCILNEC